MAHQSVMVAPLSSPFGAPQADDTLLVPSDSGFMLLSDTPANTVYMIRRSKFVSGTAYSAALSSPDSNGASVGFVGVLDLNFGNITPVATGFKSPHGMAFVKTHSDDHEGRRSCDANKSHED